MVNKNLKITFCAPKYVSLCKCFHAFPKHRYSFTLNVTINKYDGKTKWMKSIKKNKTLLFTWYLQTIEMVSTRS